MEKRVIFIHLDALLMLYATLLALPIIQNQSKLFWSCILPLWTGGAQMVVKWCKLRHQCANVVGKSNGGIIYFRSSAIASGGYIFNTLGCALLRVFACLSDIIKVDCFVLGSDCLKSRFPKQIFVFLENVGSIEKACYPLCLVVRIFPDTPIWWRYSVHFVVFCMRGALSIGQFGCVLTCLNFNRNEWFCVYIWMCIHALCIWFDPYRCRLCMCSYRYRYMLVFGRNINHYWQVGK